MGLEFAHLDHRRLTRLMTLLLVFGVVFLAAFTQALSGFGLALVSMPLLVEILGIQLAAPFVAAVGVISQIIIMIRYRHALDFSAIKTLGIGSVIGIPLGVLALEVVNEAVVTSLLGVILIVYALYALLGFRLPEIKQAGWGYGFGLVGGLLTGAYNSGGPALVVYGSSRNWSPGAFKGNLQSLLFIHSVTVLAAHLAAGNFSRAVVDNLWVSIPAVLLGVLLGFSLDRYLSVENFRKLVFILLVVLGIRLLFA